MIFADLAFLNDERRIVPPEHATLLVNTEIDEHDRVVRETWSRYPAGSLRMESATLDHARRLVPAAQAAFKVETVVGPGDQVIHEQWLDLSRLPGR